MSIPRPQSFYKSSITEDLVNAGSETTLNVAVAPTETKGFLVIDKNSSTNREIVYYTGVTGTQLTGLIRGLALSQTTGTALSLAGSTSLAKVHSAGATIEMTNSHYYQGLLNDVLAGNSHTQDNLFKIGDAADSDIYIYAHNADGNKPYLKYDAANSAWVFANDGASEINVGGASLVTEGDGIDITGGVIKVNVDSAGALDNTFGAGTTLGVNVGNGIAISTNALVVDLATDPGLEFSSAKLQVKAGVGIGVTSVGVNNLSPGYIATLNAGETINGATLPVPVYIKAADGEVYACDGNDATTLEFVGFATSNSTDGVAIDVQLSDVVSGFSGLTVGARYYVQDDKTIGTAEGTYRVLVGVALSATQILISKEKETITKTGADSRAINSTGTQVITHGIGRIPRLIQINAVDTTSYSFGTATGTSNETCSWGASAGGGTDAVNIIHISTFAAASLSAIDATTFTLNWGTNSGSGATRYFQWTAIY